MIRELFKIDTWAAPFYGISLMTGYMLWITVLLILIEQFRDIPDYTIFIIALLLGGVGSYYYGVRSYNQRLCRCRVR